MKVFVTGVRGQLGYDVVRELEKRGMEAIGVDIQEMDITDAESVITEQAETCTYEDTQVETHRSFTAKN